MKSRFSLITGGLFPETLPPCFVSKDAKRAFHGIVSNLDERRFQTRKTEYSRYNSTKHDGNRRDFGTPNIVNYFHVSSFIWRNWKKFDRKFRTSEYSIGRPELLSDDKDRSLKVPSLSELSKKTSSKLRHAPYVLKCDISQCFHSIYTHSIPWAAHGVELSKSNLQKDSKVAFFNELDFHIRNGQKGHTRGVLIGPDAYRLVAEFILSHLDSEINSKVKNIILGASRHVDDYYIGLQSEHDAHSVLSHIRETLSNFELNINDHKTKIMCSLDPINDLWAQRLRDHTGSIDSYGGHNKIERAISESVFCSKETGSSSPIKILFRSFDNAKLYRNENSWSYIEQNIQRMVQKHPHAIDYACLLVSKRKAVSDHIDHEGWTDTASKIIKRSISLSHDHEIMWMLWLLAEILERIPDKIIDEVEKYRNPHVKAFLSQAYISGKCKKPDLKLGQSLSSTDSSWLVNIVSRSNGFTNAPFSGQYSEEFRHLAEKSIILIDFDLHKETVRSRNSSAISRVRYGYDDDENPLFPLFDFEDGDPDF